jgi:hypothetical protein
VAGILSSIAQDHADASYVLQGRMQTIGVLVLDRTKPGEVVPQEYGDLLELELSGT